MEKQIKSVTLRIGAVINVGFNSKLELASELGMVRNGLASKNGWMGSRYVDKKIK